MGGGEGAGGRVCLTCGARASVHDFPYFPAATRSYALEVSAAAAAAGTHDTESHPTPRSPPPRARCRPPLLGRPKTEDMPRGRCHDAVTALSRRSRGGAD